MFYILQGRYVGELEWHPIQYVEPDHVLPVMEGREYRISPTDVPPPPPPQLFRFSPICTPEAAGEFLTEIIEVYRRHGLAIGRHETLEEAPWIGRHNPGIEAWLRSAKRDRT